MAGDRRDAALHRRNGGDDHGALQPPQGADALNGVGPPERAAGPRIVLASESRARRAILRGADIAHVSMSPGFDEGPLKAALRARKAGAEEAALALAEAKARKVSQGRPGDLVIGADQGLECEGAWFDKPRDRNEARQQLLALRGRTHRLLSAVAVATDERVLWRHVEEARLTMRVFSDDFLESYLTRSGDDVLQSVGAYRLEGIGAQLFQKIEGEYFTILGLPLFPLLDFLRNEGAVMR